MEYRIYKLTQDAFRKAERENLAYEDLAKDPANFDFYQMGHCINYRGPGLCILHESRIMESLSTGDILLLIGGGQPGAWSKMGGLEDKRIFSLLPQPMFFLKETGKTMNNCKAEPEPEKPVKCTIGPGTCAEQEVELTQAEARALENAFKNSPLKAIPDNMVEGQPAGLKDKMIRIAEQQPGRELTIYLLGGYRMDRCVIAEIGNDYLVIDHTNKKKLIPFSALSLVFL